MENDLVEQRKQKIRGLRESGVNPFPNDFKPADTARGVLERFADMEGEQLEGVKDTFTLAGRITAIRDFGKSAFFQIADRTGKIQGYLRKDIAGEESVKAFKDFVDIGDIVGITGGVFRTRTGELTIQVQSLRLLTKALRPLPEKWHGLRDVETRYRQRYLDLIANEQVRETFIARTEIIRFIRRFLDARDYLEVETPILHPIPGGAAAKPFVTHHAALDMELYLRIAPELYLKRLLVGGFERVYELGRTFRNEGISTQHNPEFSMLEFYQAYATYEDLMDLIEEMLTGLAETILGTTEFEYQGTTINMQRPWRRINIVDSLVESIGADVLADDAKLFARADELGLTHHGIRGKAMVELFEHHTGDHLTQPTFVFGFPLDVSPLARMTEGNPEFTDRFELYITGREMANAFSELNDPEDQESRFLKQADLKLRGEEEVHEMDRDFITALEHGMPPAAGAGIGIDRLVMLLTDSPSIREVLFFPHLKPE